MQRPSDPSGPIIALLIAVIFAGSVASEGAARVVSRTTRHLAFTAALSSETVTPGTRILIAIDVTPKKGMHVYAPGTKYRPIAITLEHQSLAMMHEAVYPKPQTYLFKPLNEEVLVYEKPFRLTRDLTPGATDPQKAGLRRRFSLTLRARLEYQACDDSVCYLPESVPMEWVLAIVETQSAKRKTHTRLKTPIEGHALALFEF